MNGTVYAGDSTGAFYAINQATGAEDWEFDATSPQSCFLDQADPYATAHTGGFGEITSSAAVATVAGTPTVFVGAGGSVFALNAVDAATGATDWQAASVATYAATSYTDGMVFAPESLALSVVAYRAPTGAPLWTLPLGSAPSSAAAISGNGVYLGAGTSSETLDGVQVPPQATGIWGFTAVAGGRSDYYPDGGSGPQSFVGHDPFSAAFDSHPAIVWDGLRSGLIGYIPE